MRIHSYAPPGALNESNVILSPGESHHLARVLRVQPGQALSLFDGKGVIAEGVINSVSKKEVVVRILSREKVPPPPVEITLIQALPKPDRFETILQKATELGVFRIQPVITRHTVCRSKDPDKQMGRWIGIIRNAAQQCGTGWLPTVCPPVELGEVIRSIGGFDAAFIGSLHPDAAPFRESLKKIDKEKIRSAALLIGPEGDFTDEEVSRAVNAGAVPVTFGKQILRTETAALFGLSVLAYELF